METFVYILTHDWRFANGDEGHFERTFSDLEEARSCFTNLQLFIETDDYDFDVKFTSFVEGDMSFSAYESVDSLVNRQDLTLKQLEVSL